MFTPPKQLVSDLSTLTPGTSPPYHASRKGASLLAVALTTVPTRQEHMRQTQSGYNISHFAVIKVLSTGFAAAPYKNIDTLSRSDPTKMQLLTKHNREGKQITEAINTTDNWPAAMRFYPYKKEGTYDKGERIDNLAAELCLSNVLSCYINAETFQEPTKTPTRDNWKLPYDMETPINPYTLCEIEVLPKNNTEALKGKAVRISRVRPHNLSLCTYIDHISNSKYPSTYEESALVQILTRIKSPSIRSDVSIERPSFFVRKVNTAAVVYNIQDEVTGLIHIVNWSSDDNTQDTDATASSYGESTLQLIKSDRSSPVPIRCFIEQNAFRYNKETTQLDKDDVIDMRLQERCPSTMHIDIESAPAKKLLNCATTEQLTRLLQLAAHMGALRLLVLTDQYWASTKNGNSCFRAIPLVDASALMEPLTNCINSSTNIETIYKIASPTSITEAIIKTAPALNTAYVIELPENLNVVSTEVNTRHDCIALLDRLVFSIIPEYILRDKKSTDTNTLDFCLQIPAALDDQALLETRCSVTNAQWTQSITYADHAYIITITSHTDEQKPSTYLRMLYTPGGCGARNTQNAILDATFDPSNATGILACAAEFTTATGMRQLLASLHASHRAQRSFQQISPYLSISNAVADTPSADEVDDDSPQPSPTKKQRVAL
jgi:hypothetical protein